ncbi:SOS response-associated peptidase [Roseibacterium beibuensis]|uniref:Abasic site processing protein n=1 Tax=[Roseibacterium] beibuensis TaxID=1193142 RepID=A0ABP9L3P8_9RHOB|nr:SOS response-associated peptidase [Roseibacterium beibuensis]MCS6623716.1 SOS response-associated peptidase [Roseibacterium beibuensis]
MCGRMTMTHPSEAMAQLFEATPSNDLPDPPRYNICPTQPVGVVTSEGEGRRYRPMRWGFLPHWYKSPTDGPLLINARAETIAEKPAFRAACRERRCLVPATGFYEWTKDEEGNRLPWYFTTPDGAPLVFAGIWQVWDKGEMPLTACAIVTCAAGDWMSETHHREPVSLAPEDWAKWLGEEGKGAARLMTPAPEGRYVRWRVDPAVNSNRATGAQLIEPLAA